jgi:hypothetical protein
MVAGVAFTQGDWIMEWYALDPVRNTGTHANGFAVDWLNQIFGEEEAWFSELRNIPDKDMVGERDGEELSWFVGNIKNTDDDRNLSNGIYEGAGGDMSNYVFYGMVVIKASEDIKTVAHIAQDDELKVWINGDLVATDTSWTGGATTTRPHDIEFKKGNNLMLIKVSEEGGGDYLNVRFDDTTLEFDADVHKYKSWYIVSPAGHLSSTWGAVKFPQ